MSADRIDFPPLRREFASPDQRLRLVVEGIDGWRGFKGQATLSAVKGSGSTVVWSRAIPQQFGPREVLVGNDGRALMLDEGINVPSRYALMLFDPQGNVVATHDLASVAQAAAATAADIKANARRGAWMGDAPVLAADGRTALVPFAGRTLSVSMQDGSLSLRR